MKQTVEKCYFCGKKAVADLIYVKWLGFPYNDYVCKACQRAKEQAVVSEELAQKQVRAKRRAKVVNFVKKLGGN